MKNFDAACNVIDGGKDLTLSTKLSPDIDLTLIFTDDNSEDKNKVNVKVELHEDGKIMQDNSCNTVVSRSSYEKLRKGLGV
ncbi:MAG: hypothetical protein K2H73_03990 [Treponemataceae bacterium]|nr:hypothetical protein [Treponemataceae bacterium]